jgi:hypothetical protein
VNGARAGVLYLAAAATIGYLWVTGNLAKVVDYVTRAAGGTPSSGAALQPTHPITLPAFGHAAPALSTVGRVRPIASHPGGAPLPRSQIA